MIFALDCGNSNICFGLYNGKNPIFTSRIRTDPQKTESEYSVIISEIYRLNKISLDKTDGAIISSVVPVLTKTLAKTVHALFNIKPLIVGPGIKTGINLKVDDPLTVGADLVCTSAGVASKYPLPALVIDLGTATKITYVDETKSFCGASIAPGVEISLNALSSNTALLPEIGITKKLKVIGTNTVDCMISGSILGTACMIDGMIERYIEVVGKVKTIVACGGLASSIIPHCKKEIIMDKNLLLEGLLDIYYKNN